ncbi:hypothetical protein Acr_22g0001470 [Actinidia rufa]|uniref:Uncharacterized protein n=1 Tax=Actinidia rufa TaxID=165716 RepID=A0A7J0GIW2_9ERIC|nr:hypothetical protein Acr_22g0001470 [Actinidia rufa]
MQTNVISGHPHPNTPNRNRNCIRLQLSTTLTNPKPPQPPPLLPSTMTVAAIPPQALPHPPHSLLVALPNSTQTPPPSFRLRRPGVLVCPERAVKSESSIARASNEIRIDRCFCKQRACVVELRIRVRMGAVAEGEIGGRGDGGCGRWRTAGDGGRTIAEVMVKVMVEGSPAV